jgi:hypothetical protein
MIKTKGVMRRRAQLVTDSAKRLIAANSVTAPRYDVLTLDKLKMIERTLMGAMK